MIKINEAVIVEGKYDRIKLESVIDGTIIETGGFSIFKDKERLNLIRRLAEKKGIIIITDSDRAGFKIRTYLCDGIDERLVKHAYIPDVLGKERRKSKPSKEGTLGVEGMEAGIIVKAFEKAGVTAFESKDKPEGRKITKADLYEDGISGGIDSVNLRRQLLKSLELPAALSANRLLNVLNIFYSYDDYKNTVKNIKELTK